MFSRFFIDRPIFATVLSIAITLAGAISLVEPADRDVSADRAADRERDVPVSRRQRPGGRGDDCRPDRAAGQRRREHDVHVVAVHQRRQLYPDGDLPEHRRFEPGAGSGAEPGGARRTQPAGRHQGDRGDDQEASARHSAGDRHLFTRWALRPALPVELRNDPAPARDLPAARASATSGCSASATTACGSGWTPTSLPPAA